MIIHEKVVTREPGREEENEKLGKYSTLPLCPGCMRKKVLEATTSKNDASLHRMTLKYRLLPLLPAVLLLPNQIF